MWQSYIKNYSVQLWNYTKRYLIRLFLLKYRTLFKNMLIKVAMTKSDIKMCLNGKSGIKMLLTCTDMTFSDDLMNVAVHESTWFSAFGKRGATINVPWP